MTPLLALALAVAAPVPKAVESPEQKLTRVFGERHAPDGTEFELVGDVLRFSKPNKKNLLWVGRGKLDEVGHVKRTVEGDFVMSVRVGMQPVSERVQAHAGLFVAVDEREYFQYVQCLGRGNNQRSFRWMWSKLAKERGQDEIWKDQNIADWEKAVLRVERRGQTLKAWVSEDGGKWSDPIERKLTSTADRVTIGIFSGGYEGAYSCEFDRFEYMPLPKPEKK